MKKIIFGLVCIFVFASCAQNITRGTQYAKMYQEKPTTILVMPPINNTNFVDAKEYFYTSLSYPLCEKGYYVVSPFLAMDVFQSESAYDSEMFINNSLSKFGEVFGADAALFTIIKDWSKSSVGNTITINIEYILKSTKTGEILFNRKGILSVNCAVSGGTSLFDLAANIINTAVTDKIVAARRCNAYVLYDLPEGKYSPSFGKDMNATVGAMEFKGVVSK